MTACSDTHSPRESERLAPLELRKDWHRWCAERRRVLDAVAETADLGAGDVPDQGQLTLEELAA